MASIALQGIHKSYGNVPVIHGVDIDVGDGEFVVLVGPSGCGKSTLLRMIAGLEGITGGDLTIGNRRVNGLSSKNRDIAMVFQNYALYPHMTVAQNMGFSLKLRGTPKHEIDTRTREAARILALEDYLERYPRHLSGGQRQRVAMGRAIVRDPSVFLFDEPLSNLDAKLRVAMRAEIKELHQRLMITTVYVTHDQVEAMTMADRIVVMRSGVVEQFGRPLEVYDRPENTFVAGFIGSPAMNLLEGMIVRSEDGFVFRTDGGGLLPLPTIPSGEMLERPLILGIRPEHIALAEPETPKAATADVVVIEPMGSETQVAMRLEGDDMLAVFRERVDVPVGTALHFMLDPERLHFFDRETQNRISATEGEAQLSA